MENILERIHQSALKFLVPLSLEDTCKVIVNEAVRLVGGHYGSILLMQNGELVRIYSSAKELYSVGSSKSGPLGSKDPRYKVIEKKLPIVLTIKDWKKLKVKFPGLRKFEDRAAIMIPLINVNKAIGVLSVIALEDEDFSKKELRILTLFGSLASLAIRKTQLYAEVSQALETRDLFISMASHELRTPLTTISGYSQLLKSRLGKFGPQEAKWIEELSWEVLRMTYLVHELLEINRIKERKFNYSLKECSLNDVINRAITDFGFTRPDRKILFTSKVADKNDLVIGDFDKLLQVMINLLENAAKFSPQKSEVSVNLDFKVPFLKIAIKDHGKGIPESELPKIFEGFYRGSNNSTEGMGLGLFLVQDIIKRHHGEITVKSKQGKGTTIEICLPKAKVRKIPTTP